MTSNSPLARLVPAKYSPHTPTVRQAAFLLLNNSEALYGGAAGGGKSDALIMGALQYVHIPGYSALLLRRTFAQLNKPGALLDRMHAWLGNTDAHWNGEKHHWRFPSGAVIEVGHMQHENDKYNYQGPEYQYVGFDELTQFSRTQYNYLHSRTRRLKGSSIPIRVRGGSNPGGVGHDWVKELFVDPVMKRPDAIFLPAKLKDNPYLDHDEYIASLSHLDPITLARLLDGDWNVRPAGNLFKREWFTILDAMPRSQRYTTVRYWDLAGTEVKPGRDPDYTCGGRITYFNDEDLYVVSDVQRFREQSHVVEQRVRQTAENDGRSVTVKIEQEPGSSGKAVISHYQRNVLAGFNVLGDPVTGPKVERARIASAKAGERKVALLRGDWVPAYLDELEAFPDVPHDDQVDMTSGGISDVRSQVSFSEYVNLNRRGLRNGATRASVPGSRATAAAEDWAS